MFTFIFHDKNLKFLRLIKNEIGQKKIGKILDVKI